RADHVPDPLPRRLIAATFGAFGKRGPVRAGHLPRPREGAHGRLTDYWSSCSMRYNRSAANSLESGEPGVLEGDHLPVAGRAVSAPGRGVAGVAAAGRCVAAAGHLGDTGR